MISISLLYSWLDYIIKFLDFIGPYSFREVIIFSDTICDLGGAKDLANYGEYSGAPSEQQTYEYAKTILSLMTAEIHPDGKILIVGGGIANFTNVAATFKVHLLKVTSAISDWFSLC